MSPNDLPPSARSSFDAGDNTARKRVGKACDRCRLKKSKCDGNTPCGRCRTDNAICKFGERKKSVEKVHPKGYVEQLEHHIRFTTDGLREIYRLVSQGRPWPGELLPLQNDGHPLTHDILDRLGLLKPNIDSSIEYHGFQETPAQFEQFYKRGSTQPKSPPDSLSPSPEDGPTTPQIGVPHFHNPDPFGPSQILGSHQKRNSLVPPAKRPRFAPGFLSNLPQPFPYQQSMAPPHESLHASVSLPNYHVEVPTTMPLDVGFDMAMSAPALGVQDAFTTDFPNPIISNLQHYQSSAMLRSISWDGHTGITPAADVEWSQWMQPGNI